MRREDDGGDVAHVDMDTDVDTEEQAWRRGVAVACGAVVRGGGRVGHSVGGVTHLDTLLVEVVEGEPVRLEEELPH